MDFGLSFNPAQQSQDPMNPQQGGGQTPIQDAIRTLSLRIPTFRGPGIAPQPLMQSQGSMGVMGAQGMPGGLQQILEQMFGGQQRQMGQGTSSQGEPGIPMPRPVPKFTPGQTAPSGGPTTGGRGPVTDMGGYDAPQDPGHFFPGQWPG
jgi:hypothetical protein